MIVRIGPYICAEWDFGGFPAWVLAVQPELTLRTSDTQYLKLVLPTILHSKLFVDSWWDVLLPKIVPYVYSQEEPVTVVQVENEYGSLESDKSYKEHLVAQVRVRLGEGVILSQGLYCTGRFYIHIQNSGVECRFLRFTVERSSIYQNQKKRVWTDPQ